MSDSPLSKLVPPAEMAGMRDALAGKGSLLPGEDKDMVDKFGIGISTPDNPEDKFANEVVVRIFNNHPTKNIKKIILEPDGIRLQFGGGIAEKKLALPKNKDRHTEYKIMMADDLDRNTKLDIALSDKGESVAVTFKPGNGRQWPNDVHVDVSGAYKGTSIENRANTRVIVSGLSEEQIAALREKAGKDDVELPENLNLTRVNAGKMAVAISKDVLLPVGINPDPDAPQRER